MTRVQTPSRFTNLAAFWDYLGRVPLERILLHPPLGTATEEAVLPGFA